jgi:hypothetical protein
MYAVYIAGGWLFPGRKRIIPYSIQTLKRLKPALFRHDLMALLELHYSIASSRLLRTDSPSPTPDARRSCLRREAL